MTELEKPKGKQPDYRGTIEVAGWVKTDKNGKPYMSCSLGNGALYFNMFLHDPAPKDEPKTEQNDA